MAFQSAAPGLKHHPYVDIVTRHTTVPPEHAERTKHHRLSKPRLTLGETIVSQSSLRPFKWIRGLI
jgi:hypothetical protein